MQQPQRPGDASRTGGDRPRDEQPESAAGADLDRTAGSGAGARTRKVYLSDRRAWPRTRSEIGQVTLWTSTTESQVVEVHDESLTGLAVLMADVSQISINRDVRLAFVDCQRWAVVRHIQPAAGDRYRVGLEWGCTDRRFLSGNG